MADQEQARILRDLPEPGQEGVEGDSRQEFFPDGGIAGSGVFIGDDPGGLFCPRKRARGDEIYPVSMGAEPPGNLADLGPSPFRQGALRIAPSFRFDLFRPSMSEEIEIHERRGADDPKWFS